MQFRSTISRGRRGRERVAIPAIAVDALGASSTSVVRVAINGHSVRTLVTVEDDEFVAELGPIDRLAAGIDVDQDVDVHLALDQEHGAD